MFLQGTTDETKEDGYIYLAGQSVVSSFSRSLECFLVHEAN